MISQTAFMLVIATTLAAVSAFVLLRLFGRLASPTSPSGQRSLRDFADDYRARLAQSLESEDGEEFWAEEGYQSEKGASKTSLQEQLRFAQLEKVPLWAVGVSQVVISLVFFVLARTYLEEPLQLLALTMGPVIVNGYLNRRIQRRVEKFDTDFPQFLLAVVSMLKTGLNPVQALESAVDNLEEDSVVRQEVELMLERFRVGVPEDRSIGSFGEDIAQPEIELFVQALLLSRRVGGNLSDTLDRLAKQVRKRRAFKMTASASVAQQRGAIWVIIGIMAAVQLYLLKMAPEMVIGAWTHPKLADYAQCAVVLLWFGVLWMRRITNIKI